MATFEQRESGYWQAKIRRKGHPTQSRTFATKKDAEAWARDVESKMDRSVFVDMREAEEMTLHAALDRYEREVTVTKRGKDVEAYRIAAWQAQKLACKSLAALRGSDFAAYRDARLKAGVAASTVQIELALVSHLFTTARREWGMEGLQNPLSAVRKPVAANARDRSFIDDEEARLLAACAPQARTAGKFAGGAQSQFLRPAVEFALATAMRQGEIADLLWENVDLQNRVARLPLTKNGSARAVPLSSAAVAILRALKEGSSDDGSNVKPLPKGPVFRTSANALKIGFIRAVKRARAMYEKECAERREHPDPRMLVDLHFHDLCNPIKMLRIASIPIFRMFDDTQHFYCGVLMKNRVGLTGSN
ncbi:tyrosine-type recombinase/integrase [Rhodocyclus tenuis]|uniref:Integrase n=1 Tax=Rhodocyclus tenuis TaxID=1066 RepID=A0A840G6I5_RHOTE|nr:site-specific integrase [Rhodocyclus tenuis]MBB4247983.1 integrase [Rhodocyclus tenuis]